MRAVGLTALTAVMWGTSFPATAIGLANGLSPTTFLLLRFVISFPVMVAVCSAAGAKFASLVKRREVWLLALLNAAGFYCQFYGQQRADATVASLLVNLSLVFAAAGGVLLLHERAGTARVAGVAAAAAGAVLVTTGGDVGSLTSAMASGDALYLAAAVSWAAYIVYSKKKTDELKWEPLAIATAIVGATALLVVPPALVAGVSSPVTSAGWETVAFTVVFNTVVPYILYQVGIAGLSAVSFAVVLMIEIVTGVLLSVAVLGEKMGSIAWAGSALILLSVLAVSWEETSGKSLSVGGVRQKPGS